MFLCLSMPDCTAWCALRCTLHFAHSRTQTHRREQIHTNVVNERSPSGTVGPPVATCATGVPSVWRPWPVSSPYNLRVISLNISSYVSTPVGCDVGINVVMVPPLLAAEAAAAAHQQLATMTALASPQHRLLYQNVTDYRPLFSVENKDFYYSIWIFYLHQYSNMYPCLDKCADVSLTVDDYQSSLNVHMVIMITYTLWTQLHAVLFNLFKIWFTSLSHCLWGKYTQQRMSTFDC